MGRHIPAVFLLWLVLTAAGLAVVLLLFDPNPAFYSQEGALVDDAFLLMTALAVPVFMLVAAVLGYSLLRFRARGEPTEDGPPLRGHAPLTVIWLAVSGVLTVILIINPGIIGLNELRAGAAKEPDVVVEVVGRQWAWQVTYPQYNVTASQLVLPVNKDVRFQVTATDVIHSFWIPGFRVKIDAVPGRITTVHVRPNRTGTFEDDHVLVLRCAELCGTLHTMMTTPVSVVGQSEFERWVSQQRPAR